MRICHVNLARGFRGGERQTELLIRELARHGIEQRAITRAGGKLAQRLSGVTGVDLLAIKRPFVMKAGLGRDWIMHAHESKAAHLAHFSHLLTGCPFVITRRVGHFPSSHWLTKSMYRQASAVVAISVDVRDIMKRYMPELEVHHISSVQAQMIADPQATRRIRSAWPGRFLIGHVGELVNSHKGQIYLIRAARRLASTHPELLFLLLGGGKDEPWLRAEAEGLDNVVFEGFVTGVSDYLAAFDMFVFPSLYEGLGSALLDAMHFGLPIVASAVNGIPEIVHHGRNGLLVPPADDERLHDAILELYGDSMMRERFAAEGRRLASQYTPARMADGYLRVYQSIAASTSGNGLPMP